MAKLTSKQERFCLEYLKDLNATQAAIRAEYSERSANNLGPRLLLKASVQARISELKSERSDRTKVDADYVLSRLVEIDQLDVVDIFNDAFTDFKPISDWPKSWRTTISAIDLNIITTRSGEESFETIIKKIKWPDKTKNLELMGKHVAVNAFTQVQDEDETGESLNISFHVSEPVKDVKVTRGS